MEGELNKLKRLRDETTSTRLRISNLSERIAREGSVGGVHSDDDVQITGQNDDNRSFAKNEQSDDEDEGNPVDLTSAARGSSEDVEITGTERAAVPFSHTMITSTSRSSTVTTPGTAVHAESSVELMAQRCRELGVATYGTKAERYARIIRAETQLAKDIEVREMIESRQAARREGQGKYTPALLEAPRMPTRLEVFTHELTHCPPEPWCEFCTMGKARDKRHRTRTLEEIEQDWPEVQMDFMFVDASITVCAWAERWTTILTAWDGDTGAPFALVVPSKSPDEYQVRSVCKWLDGLMHSCLLYTSPSPRDKRQSRMPSSA